MTGATAELAQKMLCRRQQCSPFFVASSASRLPDCAGAPSTICARCGNAPASVIRAWYSAFLVVHACKAAQGSLKRGLHPTISVPLQSHLLDNMVPRAMRLVVLVSSKKQQSFNVISEAPSGMDVMGFSQCISLSRAYACPGQVS